MYGLMASGEKQDWADPQEPLIDSEKVGFKLLNQFPQTPYCSKSICLRQFKDNNMLIGQI